MSSRVPRVSPIILLKKQTSTDSDATEVFKSFASMVQAPARENVSGYLNGPQIKTSQKLQNM